MLGGNHVVDLIVQKIQAFVGRRQSRLPQLGLDQLGFQFCLGILKLFFFFLQLLLALDQGVRSGTELGFRPRDLPLGVFQILLLVLQLLGRVVQFPVHGVRDFPVQRVDHALVQHHMDLLLDLTGGCDPGHTGDALQLVHQGVVYKFRQSDGVHPFHGQRCHFHRQHGGVDLQHIGAAYGVVPAGGQGGDLLLNVHANGVHIH